MHTFEDSLDGHEKKMKAFDILKEWIDKTRNVKCYLAGSTASNLGHKNSDIDIILFEEGCEKRKFSYTETIHKLKGLKNELEEKFRIEKIELIEARVPLVNALIKFEWGTEQIQFLYNNKISIRNTRAIIIYSWFDVRFRPLVLTILDWAERNDLRNSKSGTLNSYGWIMLPIHYLQEKEIMPRILENSTKSFAL